MRCSVCKRQMRGEWPEGVCSTECMRCGQESRPRVGVTGLGLRWAILGEWRVMAYVEGGYSTQRWNGGTWGICRPKQMPTEVHVELTAALGL